MFPPLGFPAPKRINLIWMWRRYSRQITTINMSKFSSDSMKILECQQLNLQWVPQLFEHLEFFHANKSCKIECCGNKMHQIVQNMILSQGLELKLSLLWRTTISGQHPLFYRWEKVYEPLLPLKYNGSGVSHSFSHL